MNMSAPASTLCARTLSYAIFKPTRPGYAAASALNSFSYLRSPVPNTTSIKSSFINSCACSAIRSNPFWSTKRDTIPMTGRLRCSSGSANTLSKFLCLNLLRVLPAHRGQIIRVNQSAFQEVHAVVKLDSLGIKQPRRQPHTLQHIPPKLSVIAHIVNRKDHRDVL